MKCSGKDVRGGAAVEVDFDSAIRSVTPSAGAADLYLAPGFIDLQVNGYVGVDYNAPATPHEEIARSIHALHATGVTRFYPTLITNAEETITGCLRNLARAKESLAEGAAMEGFHIEGPHISPKDGVRGAHARRWVRRPDFDEFERWQEAARGHIRIVTVAPEWPEAARYIERVTAAGAVAAVGHTNGNAEDFARAVRAGATMSTHLGNAAPFMLRRHPNFMWDQLAEDGLMASFIVDGAHLPPSFVRVALRAKGLERSVLVTDAASPAGCAPGRYVFAGIEVELTPDGRVVMAERERLAGSALRMDRAIENVMRFVPLTLAEAVRMATTNAARAGQVPGRLNGLVPGDRADFTLFRFDAEAKKIQVVETWMDGRRVCG
jgi:N-acetylglucosamine-6-phosphate deacetylase